MLIQTGIPRPRFDVHEKPEYVVIHTLAKAGVSTGEVFFSATVDPEHGARASKSIDPIATYPIEGEDGFQGYEYVLPFWELFKHTITVKNSTLAKYGAQGYGHKDLVPFTTNGFYVNAKSAFRASTQDYEEHMVSFQILMPVTGGGVLRLADCPFDLSNPTFNPYAPHPRAIQNLETQESLNRTHRLRTPDIEKRKAERIKAAEASMAAEERKTLPDTPRSLPPRRR